MIFERRGEMRNLLLLVLLLAVTGAAGAVEIQWRGTISQDWTLPGNWNTGAVPGTADLANINRTPGPLLDSASISVGNIKVGGGTLTVSGATLNTTSSWLILGYDAGTTGDMTFNSGTINTAGTMYVGFSGNGNLTMNDGTMNVNGARFGIGYNSSASVGHVYLNGGVITAADFSMAKNAGATATMDIKAGKLVLSGDKTGTLETYIGNGWITGYGSAANVRYDYNETTPGKTTLWAVPEPATLLLLGLGSMLLRKKF